MGAGNQNCAFEQHTKLLYKLVRHYLRVEHGLVQFVMKYMGRGAIL